MQTAIPSVETLKNLIEDEVVKALALAPDGRLRGLVDLLCRKAFYRISELGVRFDQFIQEFGFHRAAEMILPEFIHEFISFGGGHIPHEGPLLVASNHPGTYDSLIIAASLGRPDIKIIAGGIPFLQHLPHVSDHILFAPRHDLTARANVLRTGIRHLQQGGALLLFPSGGIDPDPAIMPGAESALSNWSRSLEIFLRRAPDTQVLVTIISGVLSSRWVRHPITWLRSAPRDRQRLAEMLQVVRQLIRQKALPLKPRVTFAETLSFARQYGHDARSTIHEKARYLLIEHKAWQE